MNLLTEVYTSNATLSEVCTLRNKFRRWINFSFRELEFLCLKDTQRNFYARFSGIVEPFLQKVPPTLFLPAPEVISFPQETQSEQSTLAILEKTFKVGNVYGVAKTLASEEVILKTLEELKAENAVVRESLDKHDEMFKAQAGRNNMIEGMLHAILSRLPPPS